MILVDFFAYQMRMGKVERRVLDLNFVARNSLIFVVFDDAVALNPKRLTFDRTPHVSADVEERVMREVHDCRLVGCSLVLDVELVVIGQFVGYENLQIAGEAILAIGRKI